MAVDLIVTGQTLGEALQQENNNTLLQFVDQYLDGVNLITTRFDGSQIVVPLPISSNDGKILSSNGSVLLGTTSGIYNVLTISPVQYIYLGETFNIGTSTTLNLSNGDLTYDRIDIAYINTATNTILIQNGTPSANPQIPNLSSDKIIIGAVYVKANALPTTANFYQVIYTGFSNQQIINQINAGTPVSNLVELHDVNISSPIDGQILTYDSLSSKYILTTPSPLVSQTTAGSGLTQTLGVIKLGGTLNQDTNININSNDFTISNGTNSLVNFTDGVINDLSGISSIEYDNRILNDSSDIISIDYDSRYLKNSIGEITYDFESSTMYDGFGNISIDNTNRKFYSSDGVDIITWDSSTSGLQYTVNAGTDFGDLSIPNVAYLKYLISIIPSSPAVNNGLTLDGGFVQLGGTLIESTNIDLDNNTFTFKNGTNGNIDFTNRILFSTSGNTLVSWGNPTNGLVMSSDLSSTFINESLITKRYVDNKVSSNTFYGTNGLQNISSNVIGLGGTLTQTTTIDTGGSALLIINGSNGLADFNNKILYANNGSSTIEWNDRLLKSSNAFNSIDWGNRYLLNNSGNNVIDWQNSYLINNAGNTILDWQNGFAYDNSFKTSIKWIARLLTDTNEINSIDYQNRIMYTSGGGISIDYENRIIQSSGSRPSIDYENRVLQDVSNNLSIDWQNRYFSSAVTSSILDWSEGGGLGLAIQFGNGAAYLKTNLINVSTPQSFEFPDNSGTLKLVSDPNQIITLSGDISGSGTSGITTTLATVNSNVGTFGTNIIIPVLTVNGKGLITSVVNTSIPFSSSSTSGILSNTDWNTFNNKLSSVTPQTITLSGDISGSGTSGITTTLATVNSNVGTFGTNIIIPVLTVNGKGLITSVVNTSIPNSSSSTSGILSNTDWTTFNNKQNTLTNPITGTGTSGQVSYFNGTTSQTSSSAFVFDETNNFLGIGGTPLAKLYINGNISTSSWTTNGIGLRIVPATYNNTSSTSGSVIANVYAHTIGIPTFTATNSSITYSQVATLFVDKPPTTGTNITNTNQYALILGGDFGLQCGTTAKFGTLDNQGFNIRTNVITRYAISALGTHTFTGSAASGGTSNFFTVTGPAHTNQATTIEVTDINFDLSAVLKIADGTVATQRTFRLQGRTYTPQTTALTLTTAVTLDITAPTAGTGTTITNNYAIRANGNINLSTAGNKLVITEGSNGAIGQTTLVAGTKAITISGLTSSSRAFGVLVSQGGTVSTTVMYEFVCTTNTLTINAVTNAGSNALNILDTSVLNYIIYN